MEKVKNLLHRKHEIQATDTDLDDREHVPRFSDETIEYQFASRLQNEDELKQKEGFHAKTA